MNEFKMKVVTLQLLCVMTMVMYAGNSDTRSGSDDIINFKDPLVKSICVGKWDANGDGELSKEEAAAVMNINDAFFRKDIISFDEFKYFTGITRIKSFMIDNATGLPIDIPAFEPVNIVFFNDSAHSSKTRAIRYEKVGAFYGCQKLESITIPKNVIDIGEKAFYGCESLTKVVSLIEEPFEIPSDVFYLRIYADMFSEMIGHYREIFTSATLYVPAKTKEKYKSIAGWSSFNSILEGDGTSSLKDIKEENGMPKRYDVYNVKGIRIQSFNDATFNEVIGSLPSGFYIINGLKVLVK